MPESRGPSERGHPPRAGRRLVTGDTPVSGRLEGKSVLVTGGGTGIGRACAARLAAEGATVTICGRTTETLAAAAAAVECDNGGSVSYVVADVTSEDDGARASQAAAGASVSV
ncbi:MAG: SDR family NAD(P)-dependent oxidoreductase, partial [Acidimicrobiaceae bacterium]|nr:SDR family NAD(P)-dependent oxidoreductase [Acidimicrobiaceae bacterium]